MIVSSINATCNIIVKQKWNKLKMFSENPKKSSFFHNFHLLAFKMLHNTHFKD